MSRLIVVAGVIQRAGGGILIGQRRLFDTHPGKWEFPGGKVRPEEPPREALRRELREELGIEAEVGTEIVRYEYHYPSRAAIELIFFWVPAFTGEPRGLAFEQIQWEYAEALPSYDFLDGDVDFVRRLAAGQYRLL